MLFEPSFKGRWRKTARLFCDERFFVAKQHFTEGETFIRSKKEWLNGR